MGKRNKLWLSIQAVTLAGVATLGACSMESEGEAAKENEGEGAAEQQASTAAAMPGTHKIDAGDGEGGEGEAGETASGPETNDLVYLTQLGLIRGHLLVGHQLYQEGHADAAKTHMKHPKSELYADLVPAFSARGTKGFAEQLEALADKVESNASSEAVTQAYNAVTKAIAANEAVVDKHSTSTEERLKLAVELLRAAGAEYALAVVDGQLKSAHEFQDSYGFTQVAKRTVDSITPGDETSRDALAKAKQLIAQLAPLWPSIVPPETVSGDSSTLYGAAARVELLAFGLE